MYKDIIHSNLYLAFVFLLFPICVNNSFLLVFEAFHFQVLSFMLTTEKSISGNSNLLYILSKLIYINIPLTRRCSLMLIRTHSIKQHTWLIMNKLAFILVIIHLLPADIFQDLQIYHWPISLSYHLEFQLSLLIWSQQQFWFWHKFLIIVHIIFLAELRVKNYLWFLFLDFLGSKKPTFKTFDAFYADWFYDRFLGWGEREVLYVFNSFDFRGSFG